VRRAKVADSTAGLVGVRVRVVLAFGIFTSLALLAFSVCPNTPTIQWISIAAVGFGLYGPQMLIGLCGAEVRTWLYFALCSATSPVEPLAVWLVCGMPASSTFYIARG
jgi:hypothetical protein